jgi:4-amino-4-deoxy-L-arabinose transferase-like glycosyltransferase
VAHQMQGEHSQRRNAGVVTSLGLFLLALLPRAIGLGVFVTADEAKWVYRSAQFLGALLRGDLAGTVVNLTPAVTTTWLGSLGLAVYYGLHRAALGVPFADWLASLPEFRADIDVLIAVRWPMVLLTSASVVAFYYLASRLTTRRVALLFALLLAFDPHFIALSRVLGHDAPAGVFAGLSILAFLQSLTPNPPWPTRQPVLAPPRGPGGRQSPISNPQSPTSNPQSLIVSGALAGLAWLSKSPAFFLIPFVGLVALVEAWRRGISLRVWLLRLALWGAIAWIVFALVWPAGWRDPVGAPYAVVHNAFLSATDKVEADAEGYWQVPDLGPFYYVVNGAFKLSPFAMLGLVAWAWLTLTGRRKASSVEWWLLVFAVLFTIFMTLGGKRSNRYILPAWPALYLLAAAGLSPILTLKSQVRIVGMQYAPRGHFAIRSTHPAGTSQYAIRTLRALRNTQYVIRGILLFILALPPLVTFPYYFSYFNPLLGGALTAPRLVKIGWGEGLDQVGRWLDSQPDAPALRVGSYYASALAPFFSGNISDVTAGGLDYVVLYRKQVQGGYPSPTILRYYEAAKPVQTVHLGGIEYARIYPGPAMQAAMANQAAFDIGILPKPLAFRPNYPYLPIGQAVTVDVLWLAGDDLPAGPSRLALQPLDDLTRRPGERSDQVFAESPARLERRADGLVVSRHELTIPPSLPRGSYGLLVDGRPLGEVEARQFTFPPLDQRLDANFGDQLRLVGYALDPPSKSSAVRLGSVRAIRLVWQAAPKAWADYTVFLHLVNADGERVAGWDAQPPVHTSKWARGEVVVDEHRLVVGDGLPKGDYRLVVGLYRSDTGEALSPLNEAGAPVGNGLKLPRPVLVVE